MNIYLDIEKLLTYATSHLLLDDLDVIYTRNALLDELKLTDYIQYEVEADAIYDMSVPDELIAPIVKFAIENGVITAEMTEKFTDKIMSIVMKRPAEVTDMFEDLHSSNPAKAFEWLYDYAIKSNYIPYTAIASNKHWEAKGTKGKLEVTINTARPEKTNEQVKNEASAKEGYPACTICKENEGLSVAGTYRRTLRTVPCTLAGEESFWQFSPYSYFNQHGIVVNSEHTEMKVDKTTLTKLLDFTLFAPNYFVGCNASLPHIGGSVLSHDHFQGGKPAMPMFKAPVLKKLKSEEHPYVKIEMLDWYNSVIRVSYTNKEKLVEFADMIRTKWEEYTNEAVDIVASTGDIKHNAITPIARKLADGNFCIDIILRSNVTNSQYPEGVFCTHKENLAIKSEAIGLIEAMGLFILPGRVEAELEQIAKYLTKEERYNAEKLADNMTKYKDIIEKLIKESNSKKLSSIEATLNVKDEVNSICENILENTAVFKKDEQGEKAFAEFLDTCGIK